MRGRSSRRARGGIMTAARDRSPWPRFVGGLTLLSAGVIFWLDRMGRLEAENYLRFWPLAVIAMGLAYLPQRKWGESAVWLAIGLFFLFPMLGLRRVPLWWLVGIWPLLFSVAGALLISQALRRPAKAGRGVTFKAAAVMGANNQRVATDRLAGGEAVALMAGCDIELVPSRTPMSEIEIEVLAFWGGIELRIPYGWRVDSHVAQILGGVTDRTAGATENAPRVVIRGAAIMGGIDVRNIREEAA